MACGSLSIKDFLGGLWILTADNDGVLITTPTVAVLTMFASPVLASPSFFWQLSAGNDGAVIQTRIAPTAASSSFLLSSPNLGVFSLQIQDDGVLYTTTANGQVAFRLPPPPNISMSNFPNLGLISSVAGAAPLTIGADYSIWSCTLNRFINEDTTNIIVVLDE